MNKAFKRSNDMKSTGLRKRLVVLTLGLAIAVTCAGCSEKIYSDPNKPGCPDDGGSFLVPGAGFEDP